MQAHLNALEKFLNDHAGAGLAELFIDHDRVDRSLGFLDRLTQQHALAQREPVGLHRAFAVQLRGKRLGSRGEIECARARRGNVVARHEILTEHLARFKSCRRLVRPPNAQAVFLEQIHNTHRQRVIRPHHREIRLLFLGEHHQCRQILRAHRHAFHRLAVACKFARDAAVARRHPQLGHPLALRQLPRQRMFPAAAADE